MALRSWFHWRERQYTSGYGMNVLLFMVSKCSISILKYTVNSVKNDSLLFYYRSSGRW